MTSPSVLVNNQQHQPVQQPQQQPFRFKFRERRNNWTCCFCCHVRTGTIFLGIYYTVMNLIALVAEVMAMQYGVYHEEWEDRVMDPVLPTPISARDDENVLGLDVPGVKVDFTLHAANDDGEQARQPFHSSMRSVLVGTRQADVTLSIVVTSCILILSLLFLYGAIRKKASYLIPILGFQVFNFTIASMSLIGYLCYPTDLTSIVYDRAFYPIREDLLKLDPSMLNVYIALILLFGMMVKAYCISVVWSCYKYFSLHQASSQCTIHYIEPDGQNLLHELPDYETAMIKYPTPPPSYSMVVNENSATQIPAPSANHPQQFLTAQQTVGSEVSAAAVLATNATSSSNTERPAQQPV